MNKKCPYCNQDLAIGYIQNGKEDIVWTPEGIQASPIINRTVKGQILLSKWKYIKMNKIKVYRCPACRILFIHEKEL